jgi:hypothetical protein
MNKKKNLHPTQSFEQMVANATSKANQNFIRQQIQVEMEEFARAFQMQMLNERAATQKRQLAFERILKKNVPWFSDEVLSEEIADLEDEIQKLSNVRDPAEKGDKVRLDVQVKKQGAEEWMTKEPNKLCVEQLAVTNKAGTYQTHKELEENVVGLRAGESKQFLVREGGTDDEPEYVEVAVKVKRVSRKATPVQAEAANG